MRKTISACCVTVMLALLPCAGGCGGGSDEKGQDLSAPPGTVSPQNAASFSEDAVVLAERINQGPWIDENNATRLHADLTRIREQYPATRYASARGRYALAQFSVSIYTDAPWREKWKRGEVAPTGEAALDALLDEYNATGVRFLFTSGGSRPGEREYDVCLLEFAQPLRVGYLEEPFRRSSPHIRAAHTNNMGSVGVLTPEITFAWLPDGTRTYTLLGVQRPGFTDSRERQHVWEFRFAPPADELVLVREYGDDLNSDSAAVL